MADPGAYLDNLDRRLGGLGFSVRRSVLLGAGVLDLLASRRRFELTKFGQMARVISVVHLDAVHPAMIMAYSDAVARYALEGGFTTLPRGLGGAVLCVPAIVADDFDAETKGWIVSYHAPDHWAAFEFPALVCLSESRVLFCTKTPIWGSGYYRGFRKFVEETLRP